MMRTIAGLGLMALALTLAACGGRQPLKPVQGQKLPAVPVGAATAPTAADLMQPSIQARPERNVELLTQSRQRGNDEFDLPPEAKPK
jgi:ABC-type glycerol-3-phosphate transport system substrate-binding protein